MKNEESMSDRGTCTSMEAVAVASALVDRSHGLVVDDDVASALVDSRVDDSRTKWSIDDAMRKSLDARKHNLRSHLDFSLDAAASAGVGSRDTCGA